MGHTGDGARDRLQLASLKKIPISRSAVSDASEPWATFSSMVLAKSPRIVPGAASAGLVAPIILRHSEIAFFALDDHRHDRAAGDETHQVVEKGLPLVLAVVALGGFTRDLHHLEFPDFETLALEPRNHFADQTALDAVRFNHCKSTFGCHKGGGYHGSGVGKRLCIDIFCKATRQHPVPSRKCFTRYFSLGPRYFSWFLLSDGFELPQVIQVVPGQKTHHVVDGVDTFKRIVDVRVPVLQVKGDEQR